MGAMEEMSGKGKETHIISSIFVDVAVNEGVCGVVVDEDTSTLHKQMHREGPSIGAMEEMSGKGEGTHITSSIAVDVAVG